jgi:ketosteroid isomerase-like protein
MQSEAARRSADEAKELVRDWWMALANNDLQRVKELLADDIIWEVKFVGKWLPSNGVTRGKEEVVHNCIEMYGAMYDVNRTGIDITNIISDGTTVVMEFVINGYTSAGAAYDNVEYISVVEVENGKIKRVREYMDALKATEAHSLV